MNRLHLTSGVPCTSASSKQTQRKPRDADTRGVAARCRLCGNGVLRTILDLGSLPLANALLTEAHLQKPERRYPLVLVFCLHCGLVQTTETLPHEDLFRHYLYFSSYSDTVLRESRRISERMVRTQRLHRKSRVVEIASNDGYLLQFYQQAGMIVLGFEPALNVAASALQMGIPTVCDFFSFHAARQLKQDDRQADLIHANNVLAHVADIDDFFSGLTELLKRDGVIVIEVPYVREMIERVEFDTIYHEHLFYFSLTILRGICERHGLAITDVERLAIHGGSLRVFMEHSANQTQTSPSVLRMLADEQSCGLTQFSFYQNFSSQVRDLGLNLLTLLRALKAQGRRIASYGASAKGATLLNHFGIGPSILDFVVDRNPVKQGLYTPGTHLLIYAPERLLEVKPDYVLLLTWNFAEEILEQQAEYRRLGGRFIVPSPELRVL